METIKVNMSPNPLDVQTIHASQNDGEARQWGFKLHNNGDVIDSSEVTDQMVFKAYKGGTEQLLPENTSTPVTSPFLGDIRYPQGLLTDQKFTYRQSPTEEDGLAKITDIKGNTLNWNQLAENGNFADGIGRWTTGGSNTLTVTNGVCKIQSKNTSGSNHHLVFPDPSIFQNGHTYLLRCEARAYGNMIGGSIFFAQQTNYISLGTLDGLESLTSAWQSGYLLFNRNDLTLTNGKRIVIGSLTTVTTDDYFELKNICVFDLTQMGLDSLTVEQFTSLFPLSYYSYNQGSLLSFNGNGIKTVGKNFVNVDFELLKVRNSLGTWVGNEYTYQGVTFKVNLTSEGYIDSVVANGTATANANLNLMRLLRPSTFFNKPITMSGCPSGGSSTKYRMTLQMQTSPYTTVGHDYGNGLNTTIPDNGEDYQIIIRIISGYTCNNVIFKPMITFQGVDQTYTPYTENTLLIPLSEFPNGMRSAGSVYDELTESKAITRIGAVDLSSLDWRVNPNVNGGFNCRISDFKLGVSGQLSSVICPLYETINTKYYGIMNTMQNMQIAQSNATQGELYLINTSYSDATAFKTAMSGVYLYYELATPTETSFTTASLVTENAEIPLSNNEGVLIGKCTEELSAEPGFHDAKIKLADGDGECYSNKIQLHVERKPS